MGQFKFFWDDREVTVLAQDRDSTTGIIVRSWLLAYGLVFYQ